MIRITLVRVGNQLIGKTVSDRWNLITLGITGELTADRNQPTLKRLRRKWGADFTFTVARSETIVWDASDMESTALGWRNDNVAA